MTEDLKPGEPLSYARAPLPVTDRQAPVTLKPAEAAPPPENNHAPVRRSAPPVEAQLVVEADDDEDALLDAEEGDESGEDLLDDDDGDLQAEVEAERRGAVSADELLKADALTRYLAELRRYPLLTRQQEVEYGQAYFDHQDPEAARALVTGNLRLVVKIAMEYRRAWVNVMDLIQEGNIGLAEAVRRYDPYRGVRFSSFARYWIRALILQFILKNFRLVSFASTRAGRKLFFRLEKERHKLMQEFGEATTQMLAERLDVSEQDIENASQLRQAPLSLNAPRSGEPEGRTLSDVLPDGADVEQQVVHNTLLDSIDEHMRSFGESLSDEREQEIWQQRMLAEQPVALAQLGQQFGVSRERIRQIEARLKQRLKAYLVERFGEGLELDFGQD